MRIDQVIKQVKKEYHDQIHQWGRDNFLGIIVLNLCLMILVMLHSAGYFEPYLPITINIVILFGVIIMRLILRVNSKTIFSIALFFMLFAAILKALKVDVWAERSMIYSFETIVVASIALLVESMVSNRKIAR